MESFIKKALTKSIRRKVAGKTQTIVLEPSQRLVYAVIFSLGMVACLTVLEAVHLLVLGSWNTEIFTVIAGLVGNVTGIFLSQKM